MTTIMHRPICCPQPQLETTTLAAIRRNPLLSLITLNEIEILRTIAKADKVTRCVESIARPVIQLSYLPVYSTHFLK